MFKRIKVLSQGYSSRRRNNKELLGNDRDLSTPPLSRQQSEAEVAKNVESTQPIKVKTHLRVVNLVDVDTVTETFKVHIVLFMEWKAPKSESPEVLAEGEDRMDVDWEPEWHPSFEIVGAMEMTASNEFYAVKQPSGTWYVHWRCDVKAEITDSMDLEEFPFDIEDLTISYRLRHSTKEAIIVPFFEEKAETEDNDDGSNHGRDSTGTSKRSSLRFALPVVLAHQRATSDLALVDLSHANVTLPDYLLFKAAPYCWALEDVRYFGRKCSTITVQLNFERSYLFYMLNVVVIDFSLVCINLGAWALEQKKGGRLVFDLILILTAINFRGMVATKLPEIGYLTLLDYYILICFAFKVFAFGFHVAQVWKPEKIGTPEVDEASAMAYIISVFAVHLLFVMYALKKRWLREAAVHAQCEIARQGNVRLQQSGVRDTGDAEASNFTLISDGLEKLKSMLLSTPDPGAVAEDAGNVDELELSPSAADDSTEIYSASMDQFKENGDSAERNGDSAAVKTA